MAGAELRALASDLNTAQRTVRTRASQVVRSSGLAIQNHARANAPVDTGALRASMHMREGNGGMSVEVAPAVHYAHFLEHGTIYIEPMMFMQSALEAVAPSFEQAMAQVGRNVL